MFRCSLVLAVTLALAGCAHRMDDTKAAVEAELAHTYTVEYSDVRTFPSSGVSCGKVNAIGRWGEGEGKRRFIVIDNQGNIAPSEDDWAIFCSEEPADALQARLGIGPLDKTNPELLTIHRQLNELDDALRRYLIDNGTFPPANPGLQSLLSGSKPGTESGEKSYIDKIPDDPWGRPYIYEKARQLHGSSPTYSLYTLGRDGIKGGRGADADIGSWHLKYLNHISSL